MSLGLTAAVTTTCWREAPVTARDSTQTASWTLPDTVIAECFHRPLSSTLDPLAHKSPFNQRKKLFISPSPHVDFYIRFLSYSDLSPGFFLSLSSLFLIIFLQQILVKFVSFEMASEGFGPDSSPLYLLLRSQLFTACLGTGWGWGCGVGLRSPSLLVHKAAGGLCATSVSLLKIT